MDEHFKTLENTHCYCKKIPAFAHELNQTLLIINSYAKGCAERIKQNNFDLEQLLLTFEKISTQIQIMGQQIHHLHA